MSYKLKNQRTEEQLVQTQKELDEMTLAFNRAMQYAAGMMALITKAEAKIARLEGNDMAAPDQETIMLVEAKWRNEAG